MTDENSREWTTSPVKFLIMLAAGAAVALLSVGAAIVFGY